MLGGGLLEGTYANCTHISVGLLKAWKVTVEGIKCNDAAFLTLFLCLLSLCMQCGHM